MHECQSPPLVPYTPQCSELGSNMCAVLLNEATNGTLEGFTRQLSQLSTSHLQLIISSGAGFMADTCLYHQTIINLAQTEQARRLAVELD